MSANRQSIVAKDRNIQSYPQAFIPDTTPYKMINFSPKVRDACSSTLGVNMAKVVLVGEVAVGKSCLACRFCHNSFDHDYKATIGVDFEVEHFHVLGTTFKIQIWDTAGQERFKSIAAAYYRSAHAVLVVFDLSSIDTLRKAKQWKEEACANVEIENPLVFLIGSKKDLVSDGAYRDIERHALQLASEIGAEFWAVSSKTGEQVKELFFRVTALMFDAAVQRELQPSKLPSKQIGNDINIKVQQEKKEIGSRQKMRCCH